MSKKFPAILIFVALAINVIQSVFLPIGEDEAYYWMYSRNLAWGYFDHPPAIAVMIWLGGQLSGRVWGVRMMTVLAWLLTYGLLWYSLPAEVRQRKASLTFYILLVMSIPIGNIYAFTSTPDVPLLMFGALYLYLFGQFLKTKNFFITVGLGLSAALMLYSKYHGFLLILFSLLPYPHLLKQRRFYVFAFSGVLFFLPHLYWQYSHDFVTFRYHLLYRSENEFLLSNVARYLLNTLLILNPVLVLFLLWLALKRKMKPGAALHNLFILIGGIGFFFVSAFRDHVEPHWIAFTVLAFVPLIHRQVADHDGHRNFFIWTASASIAVILVARILSLVQGSGYLRGNEDNKAFFKEIKALAGDRKVAFINSYHRAARYTFYTGEEAFSYNCMPYGKKQYDYWPYEKTYHNRDVFLVGSWPSHYLRVGKLSTGKDLLYVPVDHFQVLSRAQVLDPVMEIPIRRGADQSLTFTLHNPYHYPLWFDERDMSLRFELFFFADGKHYTSAPLKTSGLLVAPPQSSVIVNGNFCVDLPKGKYQLGIALKPGFLTAVPVAPRFRVNVTD